MELFMAPVAFSFLADLLVNGICNGNDGCVRLPSGNSSSKREEW